MNFFSFHFPFREYFVFLDFAPPATPPHKFSNGPSLRLCYLDDPNSLSILLLQFFFYSFAVLCLVAYVNLTFMSCKTELSLINHLVLACLDQLAWFVIL